ncbi:unnamed protein product [Soboliphyme baturini]|uniref:Elongator complex protein 6 n=1 Tax=Soboliphyme baturini TaxID=241478 RepID=A0A183IAS8_9BILA|nr:unnamed protein product [Soboliphyme baturini]
MYVELGAKMGHSCQSLPEQQMVLIRYSWELDGSFLLYHFLSMYFRANGRVLLVAVSNSAEHYDAVLAKFGFTVKRLVERKVCYVIDVLKLLSSGSWSNIASDGQGNLSDVKEENVAEMNSLKLMDVLWNCLSAASSVIQQDQQSPVLVVVDDVSLLNDFGVPLHRIIGFLHGCRKVAGPRSCFCVSTSAEQRHTLLSAYLSHMATWLLDVRPLGTGMSSDVHGQVNFF